MNNEFHIDDYGVEYLKGIGDVICVSAHPWVEEDGCYSFQWIDMYLPYSERLLKQIEEEKDNDMFYQDLDDFVYEDLSERKENIGFYDRYGYVRKDCYRSKPSEIILNPVDLGLSVLWSDRNYGSSSPEDQGLMLAFPEFASIENTFNGWRLPTIEEFEELLSVNPRKRQKIDNVCILHGDNGEHLLIPIEGIDNGSHVLFVGDQVRFLCKENTDSPKYGSVTFFPDLPYPPITREDESEKRAHSIRLVKDK